MDFIVAKILLAEAFIKNGFNIFQFRNPPIVKTAKVFVIFFLGKFHRFFQVNPFPCYLS